MSTDPIDLPAIEARNTAAHDHVVKLCRGEEDWTMRIPAQPDRDSDLVIDAALADVLALVAEVRRLRGERERCGCSCHDCCVCRWTVCGLRGQP